MASVALFLLVIAVLAVKALGPLQETLTPEATLAVRLMVCPGHTGPPLLTVMVGAVQPDVEQVAVPAALFPHAPGPAMAITLSVTDCPMVNPVAV